MSAAATTISTTTTASTSADPWRWIVEPDARVVALAAPLLRRLAGCPGGWPDRAEPDWCEFTREKFGPQAFVFSHPLDTKRLYLKWLPRILLTKRRRGLALWPSPALQHARWTERVRTIGVDVVDLLAAGELTRAPLDVRHAPSFVITCSPDGSRTVRDALLDDDLSMRQRAHLADLLAEMATRLHAARVRRVDLRAANLLVESGAERLLLFDFDSFRYDRTVSPRALARHRAKDLLKVNRTRRILLGHEPVPEKWKAQRARKASVSQT